MSKTCAALIATSLVAITPAFSVAVTNETELNTEIASNSTPIDFSNNISRADAIFPLRPVNTTDTFSGSAGAAPTINGMGFSYIGSGATPAYRGLTFKGPADIENITFTGCAATGGRGGSGRAPGGGGAGLGGALLITDTSSVTATNCTFTSCSAVGGDGGDGTSSTAGMGGGGSINGLLRTQGGDPPGGGASTDEAGGGGGGFGGKGGDTIGASGIRGGGGGGLATAGGDGTSGVTGAGGDNFPATSTRNGGNGGFGGAGEDASAAPGAGGGGGGGGGAPSPDGTANVRGGDGFTFAGAGGGGQSSTDPSSRGGDGAFGGGGGGCLNILGGTGRGGNGGFGGGGGATTVGGASIGTSLFGGGSGGLFTSGSGGAFGGAIFIMDGGSLTLMGTTSFSGNSVTAGSVTSPATAGSTAGTDIFMVSGASLTYDSASTLVLQNPIEGSQGPGGSIGGGLTKSGSGLLVLSGDNTYSDTTTVTAGELRINSSVQTDIEVTGGTLSGNFSTVAGFMAAAGDLTVSGTGVFSPGINGVGTVTLAGVYDQSSGTPRLLVDVTPSGFNDTFVAGSATITAGDIAVFLGEGNYIEGTEYSIFSGTTTIDPAILANPVKLGPNASNVDILLKEGSLIVVILENRIFEDQIIDSGPPRAVVKCLREGTIIAGSDLATVVEVLGTLPDSAVNTALTTLSGDDFAALEWINARNTSRTANILDQHVIDLCCSPRELCVCPGSGWVSVYGNFLKHRKSYNFLRPFKADSLNVAAGYDYLLCDCLYVGAAFIWTGTQLQWKANRGGGNLSAYTGALYASWDWCNIGAYLSLQGGGTQNDLKRHIEFGETLIIDRNARSCFWDGFLTAHLKLDYDWSCWDCLTVTPYGIVDYHYYARESFSERGADSINLNVKSKDQNMMRTEAGIYAGYDWLFCGGECFSPYLGLSWVGEFPLHKSKEKASLQAIPDCTISFTSYNSMFNFASPTAGFKWTKCNGLSFVGEYKGIFNGRTRISQIEARLERVF